MAAASPRPAPIIGLVGGERRRLPGGKLEPTAAAAAASVPCAVVEMFRRDRIRAQESDRRVRAGTRGIPDAGPLGDKPFPAVLPKNIRCPRAAKARSRLRFRLFPGLAEACPAAERGIVLEVVLPRRHRPGLVLCRALI